MIYCMVVVHRRCYSNVLWGGCEMGGICVHKTIWRNERAPKL